MVILMGMMYGSDNGLWFFLYKTSVFVLACFVFSVVFWSTKHWLEMKKGKKDK